MSQMSINGLDPDDTDSGAHEDRNQTNPGNVESNENRNPSNFFSENRNPAHFALGENISPPSYGTNENRSQLNFGENENRSPPNYTLSESRSPPRYTLSENRNPSNFGSNENRNLLNFASSENRNPSSFGSSENRNPPSFGSSENRNPSSFGSSENRNPPSFGSSENRNPPSFGSSENRNPPSFGSSENRNPPSFGSSENRNPPSFGSSENRNPPSFGSSENRNPLSFGSSENRNPPSFGSSENRNPPSFGSSESRNPPTFECENRNPHTFGLSENRIRNQPTYGLSENRNQHAYGLSENRNQVAFGLSESRKPLNFVLTEDQSISNFGLNQDRKSNFGLNGNRTSQNFRLNDDRNPPNFRLNDRNVPNFGLNDRNPNFAFSEDQNQANFLLVDKRNILPNYELSKNRNAANFPISEDRNKPNIGSTENRKLTNYVLSEDRNTVNFASPEDISPVCELCPIRSVALYKCFHCGVSLCVSCAEQHRQNPSSQNHPMCKLSSGNNSQYPIMCGEHQEVEANIFCQVCNIPLCSQCSVCEHNTHEVILLKDRIQMSRKELAVLEADVDMGRDAMKKGQKKIEDVAEGVERTRKSIHEAIERHFNAIIQMIINKQQELIQKTNSISKSKEDNLSKQKDEMIKTLNKLREIKLLIRSINMDDEAEVMRITSHIAADVNKIKASAPSLEPCEDEVLEFRAEDNDIFEVVNRKIGSVHSSSSARFTNIAGRNVSYARTYRRNNIIVHARDHSNLPLIPKFEKDNLKAVINDISFDPIQVDMEIGKSSFRVSYIPRSLGMLQIKLKLRGVDIQDSPVNINVIDVRDYNRPLPKLPITFGTEGGGDGQLCRPWGVCCDGEGNIIVADRSNNRIQIFSPNGEFKLKFGCHGSEPRQFDRPAGIAWDSYYNRIIVSDKDNHRIQIFDMYGEFIMLFGEKGFKNGSFNYPWDVDVNEQGTIIVSDTRNHRVQLFSPKGEFLAKFGSEVNSSMWKIFDSPRGVCFDPNGKIIVTDFNHHRIGILNNGLQEDRWLGSEGDVKNCYSQHELKFLRPQGVATDADGNIVVADSRNHRIVVFNQAGIIIRTFGTQGNAIGCLDRPSGVCMSPDGRIVVVDFGNNRIQIF